MTHAVHAVSYDEARSIVRTLLLPRRTQSLSTWHHAHANLHLAKDIYAPLNLPYFSRAMMDGFAIHVSDLYPHATLAVIGDVCAGDSNLPELGPGQAVTIRTGAPIPKGTAAVVRKEWVQWLDERHIQIQNQVKPEESVQLAGSDIQKDNLVLPQGTPLRGTTKAILRAMGLAEVEVFAPPRVAVFSTGSELITDSAGQPPFGKVHALNDAFLVDTLLQDGVNVVETGFLSDSLEQTRNTILRAINQIDVLLLTGGASVGDTDFAKQALRELAGTPSLPVERVRMRPGAPFLAGRIGHTTVFGLSGNPTACFVQFHTLARGVILDAFAPNHQHDFVEAELVHSVTMNQTALTRFYRGQLRMTGGRLTVEAHARQSTGEIANLPFTNALIRLEKTAYEAGEVVQVMAI